MKLIWLGHSAFRIELGKAVILIDPFLTGNPKFTGDAEKAIEGATHVLLTHGHDDHIGDAARNRQDEPARRSFRISKSACICNAQGAENINPGNTGGTIDCGAFTVSFTQALHSSGTVVNGQVRLSWQPQTALSSSPRTAPSLYHMGDTDIFSDMALIAEIHAPKIGLVPVGDRFTMSGADGGARGQALFHLRDRHSLPLWNLRSARPGREPLRRGDARPCDKDRGAAHRRGPGVLIARGICPRPLSLSRTGQHGRRELAAKSLAFFLRSPRSGRVSTGDRTAFLHPASKEHDQRMIMQTIL